MLHLDGSARHFVGRAWYRLRSRRAEPGNSGKGPGPAASAWNLLSDPYNNGHPAGRVAHSSPCSLVGHSSPLGSYQAYANASFQYNLVSRMGGAMQIAGEVAEETQPLCCSANSFRIQVRTIHNEYYRNRMLRRIWSGVNRPRAVKMQGDHGIPGTRTD